MATSITVSRRAPYPVRPRKPVVEKVVEPTPPPVNQHASNQRRSYARSVGQEVPVPSPTDAPDVIAVEAVAHDDDLAAVVVKRTLRSLAAGSLEPTLRDGLIAQQLLDRREEKAQDRRFMLTLAQALAGGGYTAPSSLLPATTEPPPEVVEGYYEEIPLAPEHLRAE